MIILIAGTSFSGKTKLAQALLEQCNYPYLSIDHLKMGLIRSGNTDLTVDDEGLERYLWSIVKEIIKTAIENQQNLIVEGIYIPFNWQADFESKYLKNIKYVRLILSEDYIENNFELILEKANLIEDRLDISDVNKQLLKTDNLDNLKQCQKYNLPFLLIEKNYKNVLSEFLWRFVDK